MLLLLLNQVIEALSLFVRFQPPIESTSACVLQEVTLSIPRHVAHHFFVDASWADVQEVLGVADHRASLQHSLNVRKRAEFLVRKCRAYHLNELLLAWVAEIPWGLACEPCRRQIMQRWFRILVDLVVGRQTQLVLLELRRHRAMW